ncbi:MAG: CdaR family protein [Mariprofundaceae bacterium]
MFWAWVKEQRLKIWALLIAVGLWFQVHGQGVGTFSVDIPLQVEGLASDMVIVNNLPENLRVTISGLQTRLRDLDTRTLRLPLDASGIDTPSIIERPITTDDLSLPAGMRIEKIQPDSIELQVDRIVRKEVTVQPHLEIPEGWQLIGIKISPAKVELIGPEVWLDSLAEIRTEQIRMDEKPGIFSVEVGVISPTGKAIRLVDPDMRFKINGLLKPPAPKSITPQTVIVDDMPQGE